MLENEEVVVPETTEEVTPEVTEEVEESIEEVKTRLEEETQKRVKAEEIATNQRIRAEKAEKDKKVAEPSALSSADLLAVMYAKVHEDDMERVERFAKSEGVSIKEALKNPEMKAILDLREEQRDTANAANVSNVRRGPSKVTDEVLIDKAAKGDLPESDAEIERLIAAKVKAERS